MRGRRRPARSRAKRTSSASAPRGRARSRSRSSTRASEFAADFLVPALQANAMYEGKYPLVSALSRPVIVEHLVAVGPPPRRRRGRARLHRQGQRPGALRGVVAHPRARPRRARAGAGVGAHARRLHRARRRSGRSRSRRRRRSCTRSTRTCGAARSSAACSRTRGRRAPEEPYTLTRSPTDAPSEPTRDRRSAFERGVPVSLDGTRPRPRRADRRRSAPTVGAYGWGRIDMVENRRVGIKSREVYECPASLALDRSRTRTSRASRSSATSRARSSGSRSGSPSSIYDGMWHAPLMRALAGVRDDDAGARDGRGAAAARGRALRRGRPARAARPLRPRPRDVRRRGRVPPPGLGGLRPAVGPVGRDVVAPPGPGVAS